MLRLSLRGEFEDLLPARNGLWAGCRSGQWVNPEFLPGNLTTATRPVARSQCNVGGWGQLDELDFGIAN
jgi:hypothetical protein